MNPNDYKDPWQEPHEYVSKWTLIKDGLVYVFRRYNDRPDPASIEICEPDGNTFNMTVESARAVWDTLINNGFVIKKENPPVSKKKQIRRQDSRKMKWSEAVSSMQHAKICKDAYRKKKQWLDKVLDNYALEA